LFFNNYDWIKTEKDLRVRPGLDSRLDILEPPFDPSGILERAFVGVRIVDDNLNEFGDVERLPGCDWETVCGGRDVTEDVLVVTEDCGRRRDRSKWIISIKIYRNIFITFCLSRCICNW